MKTASLMIAAGASLALAAAALAAPITPDAPGPDKVDLTPKFKTGQTHMFKQHLVRKDTMILGNLPSSPKDAPKSDAPKDEKPKLESPKEESPKGDKPQGAVFDQPTPKADPKAADGTGKPAPAAALPEGPASSTQKVDQTATYELRVIEASDTGVSLELELKSITATAELPQGKFTWDSTQPPDDKDRNNPIVSSYRPIIGGVTKIRIGKDGNFDSVDADPRINTVGARGPLAPMVQQLVAADGVRLRWSPVLWIKDGHDPATVGQSWPNADEILFPAVGRFTYNSANTLKSVKDGMAEIDITGDVKLTGAEPGKAPSGSMRDQHATGACLWDANVGMVKNHRWEQKYTLDVDAMGIHVSRVSEFTVTTTRQ